MRRLALMLSAVALATVATPQHALTQSTEDAAAVSAKQNAERRSDLLRRANTYHGPVGGINVVEAGSGAPRSFRLSVYTDFFFKDDYLYDGDDNRYVGGALSLGITPIEHLEITAALTGRSLKTEDRPPGTTGADVYNTVGDPYIDIKTYGAVSKGVTLGGDLLLNFLSAPAADGLDFAGTSFGVRGNLSFDLREMPAHVPLELRLNAGYYFDQSHKVVEDEEDERLAALVGSGQVTNPDDEVRHLAPRNQRLAFAVNRVDHFGLALGLEAPLKLSKNVALHPILEWEMWMPINRQGYDCPRTSDADDDSCLDAEGAGVWPQRLTAGARLFPALSTFSLLAGIELGLGGTKDFVRELAPTPPYRVFVSAAYSVDFAPQKVEQVEKRVEIPVAVKQGRVTGQVFEQGANTPIEGAQVMVQGTQLSPLVTSPDGSFVGYQLPPGNIVLSIAAEGYEPGTCATTIPPEGGDAAAQCMLVALPRLGSVVGSVVGKDAAALAGVQVRLSGPVARTVSTGADGIFRDSGLPPGAYQVHIDHQGYFLSNTPLQIEPRKEATVQIALVPKSKTPLVVVQKTRLVLRGTVLFNTGTAQLDARSGPLMTEIADVLLRTPAISKIEVQGHTDNVGAADFNLTLSQQRAEAVRDWLIRSGVAPERLEAKGYGHNKPIAPNVTPAGKAKNRRVAFIITERATTIP
jgi:OmpA-OmpF porin, OOP family